MDTMGDMAEKRRKAENWINGYMVGGVAAVVAGSMIPGTATAILCGIELTMCYQLGLIYKDPWTQSEAKAAASAVGLAAVAGKILALETAILLGPFAPLGKGIIAAGIIKALGTLVIKHFEDTTDPESGGAGQPARVK